MTQRRIPLARQGQRWRERVLGRYAGLLQQAVERGEITSTEATRRLTEAVATR